MSANSPSSGTATRSRGRGDDQPGSAASADGQGERAARDRLEIGLEHMRWRHFTWAAFGLISGGFLVWKLGTVGKGVGAVLLLAGLWATWSFVRTLLFPAGTIVLDGRRLSLPRGLCRPGVVELSIDDVRHAYFLRRAVPWTRAAPVLVIETEREALIYPRDWFATEADQRRIVSRLVDGMRRGEARVEARGA